MAKDGINLDVNFEDVQRLYAKTRDTARDNMQKLTKQMARRVPRLAGKRVAERYNIPANEVQPPAHKVKTDRATGAKREVKKLARVNVKGDTLDSISFTWEGRRPTVQRFKMKPTTVPENPRESYDITFSVLRGERQALENDEKFRYFVQDLRGVVQAVYAYNDRSPAVNRKIAGVAKVLSVPIMIDNKNVRPLIRRDINDLMLKEIKRLYKK